MPRHRHRRCVGGHPPVTDFNPVSPRPIPQDEIILTIEEFEAVRLKDNLGLSQTEAAERMNISQPTFHRQLLAARKKIADALVNGKAIRIEKR